MTIRDLANFDIARAAARQAAPLGLLDALGDAVGRTGTIEHDGTTYGVTLTPSSYVGWVRYAIGSGEPHNRVKAYGGTPAGAWANLERNWTLIAAMRALTAAPTPTIPVEMRDDYIAIYEYAMLELGHPLEAKWFGHNGLDVGLAMRREEGE